MVFFVLSLSVDGQWQVTEFKYAKAASAIDLKKQQFFSSKERPELDPALSALIGEDVKKSIDAKRSAELDYVPTTDNPVLTTSKSLRRSGAADDTVVVDSIAGSSSEKKQVDTYGARTEAPSRNDWN